MTVRGNRSKAGLILPVGPERDSASLERMIGLPLSCRLTAQAGGAPPPAPAAQPDRRSRLTLRGQPFGFFLCRRFPTELGFGAGSQDLVPVERRKITRPLGHEGLEKSLERETHLLAKLTLQCLELLDLRFGRGAGAIEIMLELGRVRPGLLDHQLALDPCRFAQVACRTLGQRKHGRRELLCSVRRAESEDGSPPRSRSGSTSAGLSSLIAPFSPPRGRARRRSRPRAHDRLTSSWPAVVGPLRLWLDSRHGIPRAPGSRARAERNRRAIRRSNSSTGPFFRPPTVARGNST